MSILETVAEEFQISPESLLHESLKEYFSKRLMKVESEMFLLAKKYGVKDVFELDSRVEEGLIREEEAHDDYFRLDYLEAERDKIRRVLARV